MDFYGIFSVQKYADYLRKHMIAVPADLHKMEGRPVTIGGGSWDPERPCTVDMGYIGYGMPREAAIPYAKIGKYSAELHQQYLRSTNGPELDEHLFRLDGKPAYAEAGKNAVYAVIYNEGRLYDGIPMEAVLLKNT